MTIPLLSLSKSLPVLGALALFAAPLAVKAQTVVFNDTFGSSTKNPTAASPGTLTATQTAYEIASSKSATSSTVSSGLLKFGNFSTGSGYCEGQALFTASPITLSAAGQYIEIYYTFNDTTTLFNGNAGNNEQINIGLYNSGGSGPTNGVLLWNSGLVSSATTAVTGGCQNWVGYNAQFAYSQTAGNSSAIGTRPAQTGANNLNQGIGSSSGYSGGVNLTTMAGVVGQPALTVGSKYTMHLRITYVNATTLAITNTLYDGVGIGGAVHSAGGFTARFGGTTSNILTPTFDAFVVGFRPTSSPTTAETMEINSVTVAAFIPTAPTISGLTNRTVVAGTSPTLNPTVTGAPTPAFQWQTNGVNIDNATNASLVLNNVQYSQDGYVYSLIASNSEGVVTQSMTLSVIVAPTISGVANQAVYVGSSPSISATVSGIPTPALQWQLEGVDLTDGLNGNGATISGSTTATLTIANAQAADSGTYSLIATNSAGIVTNSMYLLVSAGDVLPTLVGPTNLTVIEGNDGMFSTTAYYGLPQPTLQWLDETGTPIVDATNATLTVSNVQYSQNGFVYSLIASNSVGSVTNSATLTVIVPPVITSQPSNLTVTNTQSASFTVAATGVPDPTYQWFKNGSPIASGSNNSATNATLVLATTSAADAGSAYYVQIANAAGSTNSATVYLTVNSTMSASTLAPANGATGVCYDTPLYLTFSSVPTLRTSGTIKIFNVTNSDTPVDTIDLSLNVTPNATYAKNVQPRNIGGDSFTNFPVILTGNTAAIYPHLGVLTSNQTYYVTLDNGTFADAAGANFAGITATNIWKFSTKIGGPANPVSLVTAADGSGDFVTVQGAVDSVPANNTTPTLITIKDGNYVEIVNIKSKHNLTLRGQTRNGTVIGYANNAYLQPSTHVRMAVKINANDIAFDNLTITNRTPAGGSQAEALMLESNAKRFIFNNCNLGSFQDTLLANGGGQSQAYFNNSLITGQFDYIWGGGVCFFTNCEARTMLGTGGNWNLVATRTDNNATGTWPGYNGLASSNGFSFVNCRLTRENGSVSKITLAGSNGTTNGVAAWINCILTLAYTNAVSLTATNSELLWEFGNTNLVGDPVPLGLTVLNTSDARYLAASSATNWLYGWQPQLAPNILTNPASQSVFAGSPTTFTVAATGIPDPTYQWQHSGTNVTDATNATLTLASTAYDDAGSFAVIVTTTAGSVTSSTATLTVTTPPNAAPVFTSPPAGTNIAINVGVNLAVSFTATDSDTPAQTLTYALLSGPSGAAVDSGTGNFIWRPTVAQSNSVNNVSVVVTDNGTPNLSATNNFTITVNPLAAPVVTAPAVSSGQFSLTITGQTGPDYTVQVSTNLAESNWATLLTTNSPAMPFTFTDTNGSLPLQFYRILVGP